MTVGLGALASGMLNDKVTGLTELLMEVRDNAVHLVASDLVFGEENPRTPAARLDSSEEG